MFVIGILIELIVDKFEDIVEQLFLLFGIMIEVIILLIVLMFSINLALLIFFIVVLSRFIQFIFLAWNCVKLEKAINKEIIEVTEEYKTVLIGITLDKLDICFKWKYLVPILGLFCINTDYKKGINNLNNYREKILFEFIDFLCIKKFIINNLDGSSLNYKTRTYVEDIEVNCKNKYYIVIIEMFLNLKELVDKNNKIILGNYSLNEKEKVINAKNEAILAFVKLLHDLNYRTQNEKSFSMEEENNLNGLKKCGDLLKRINKDVIEEKAVFMK
ncbi:hypothetical protein [Clostridioides difficile]|uniref:hypothetical protein n=1 Tax=Clostridioides difficile TaxID=1496 RepID=UPI000BB1B085|nr:hypothetical protein [Clostridioides difficile]PBF99901.1 hypothetical protein BGV00_06720 [Clostridioides difficile]